MPRPSGDQFQINTYTTSNQQAPSVAAEGDGDFVVVWQSMGSAGADSSSYSVQGRRYTSNGVARGNAFQINTYTTAQQEAPAVAAVSWGGLVVAWQSAGSFGTDLGFPSSRSIQDQRYTLPLLTPALSFAARFALGAALLLVGGALLGRRWKARTPHA